MQRQIVLSKIAEKKLDNLFEYFESNWTEGVKLRFISKLENSIQIIQQNPETFPKSAIRQGLHKCVISRQTTMYYTFDDTVVYILTIFDNRQDPEKLIEDLQ